jgi:hypothetical protein
MAVKPFWTPGKRGLEQPKPRDLGPSHMSARDVETLIMGSGPRALTLKPHVVRLLAIAIAGILTLLLGCTPGPPKPTLLIYGDSVTVLSESAVTQLYGTKYHLVFRAYGGTAMCDWAPHAAADRVLYHPARVVLAFTGNSHTCVANDLKVGGVPAFLANYSKALTEFHSAFVGLPISVVASPAMQSLSPDLFPENGSPTLNQLYQTLCAQLGMTYNPAADNALTPGHIFTAYRPAYGTTGPLVAVRTGDGVHVTPAGAVYYAHALAG